MREQNGEQIALAQVMGWRTAFGTFENNELVWWLRVSKKHGGLLCSFLLSTQVVLSCVLRLGENIVMRSPSWRGRFHHRLDGRDLGFRNSCLSFMRVL